MGQVVSTSMLASDWDSVPYDASAPVFGNYPLQANQHPLAGNPFNVSTLANDLLVGTPQPILDQSFQFAAFETSEQSSASASIANIQPSTWTDESLNFDLGLQEFDSTFQYPWNDFPVNAPAVHQVQQPILQAQYPRIAPAVPELQATLQPTVAAPHAPGSRDTCNVPGCGKTFGRAAEFRRHKQTVHGEKKFRCMVDSCDYSYGRLDKVREHMARMHGIHLQVEKSRRSALLR